jgi:thiol-disulfide isomerase/thioredoxin
MKRSFLLLAALALATACAAPVPPEARAAFKEAQGQASADMTAAAAAMRQLIDRYPDFYDAHQYFTFYSRIAVTRTGTDDEKRAAGEKVSAELEALYQTWAKEQPDRAAYQYALGGLYEYSDPDRAVRHFEAAVKLDPKCGPAFRMLAICAEVRGQLAKSRDYLRQAVEAEPDNPQMWRSYVAEHRESDINRGIALGLEMAKKFPDEAASIIGYLATRQRNEAKALEIYELLREKFPKASASNLTTLFSLYLKSDAPKALALAEQMVGLVPENKQWPVLVDYAKAVRNTDPLIAEGKAADALAALNKITLPRYGADRRWLDLAKARATAASEMGQGVAYTDLLALCAKTPTDETQSALVSYGRQLGKSPQQVAAELMASRAAAAKPAVPFTLTNYATGKPVSLDDYIGRVVMVNFWYPMCGPCRGEFPFLQAVLEKYRDRGFEILAINGHAPEDHMVLPLLTGWKLDFLPLKSDGGAVDKNYKVRGYPANFLYGPDGKIYYEPPPVSTLAAQRELELQIEALLAAAKSG